jgi:uncharacterized protein (TIGR03437 family)
MFPDEALYHQDLASMTSPTRCLPAIALLLATGICFGQTAVTVTAIQNGASFTGRITPGAFVTIKGTNFTTGPLSAAVVPVPILLGGVSVSVAGLFCPIYYVNPTQINLLLPWKTPIGSYPLIVTANGQTVGPTNITITAEAPGIFQYGANRAVAQNLNNNYSLNGPGAPAAAGSTIVVYVTGVGLVSNQPADGAYSLGPPSLSQAAYINSATIGGVNAAVTFLGLTPTSVGLAQANITVPNLPSGDYPLILTVAGLQSTSALISVQGTGSGLPLVFNPIGTVAAPSSPLEPPLQGAMHANGNVVVSGNDAYLCDANGIAILDVSHPATPQYLSNFGQYDVNGAGEGCALYQGDLLASASALLNVYNLATPTSPQRIGQNQFYFGNTFLSGTNAYVSTQAYNTDPNSLQITTQTGDFYVYDMTNPALPKLDAQLVQNFLQQGSADTSPREGLTVFNNQTAIVLGTSAAGTNTSGQALWTTIDVTVPTKPAVLGQTMIPNASMAVNLALQGTQALIVGNTAGVQNPPLSALAYPYTGNLTLHLADFTNPLSGAILGTLVTPYQTTGGYAMASLGGGFFAVTLGPPLTDLQGPTTLAVVDARNPASMVVYPEYGVDGLQGISLVNGMLYTVSNAGLTIYSVTVP